MVENAGADRLRASLFIRYDLGLVALDLLHAVQQVGDQNGPLLHAERIQLCDSLLDRRQQRLPLFVGDALRFGRHHVGQTHDGGEHRVVTGVDPGINERVVHLPDIFAERLPVDTGRGLRAQALHRHEQIHLAALHPAGDDVADFVFRLAVNGRDLHIDIQLLGVQRTDFDRDFPIADGGFALAEAGHRFYHGAL